VCVGRTKTICDVTMTGFQKIYIQKPIRVKWTHGCW